MFKKKKKDIHDNNLKHREECKVANNFIRIPLFVVLFENTALKN